MSRVELIGVEGIAEVAAGADLAALIADAMTAVGERLQPGDLVVVSSKVVSKAEGRTVAARTRDAAIDAQTVRVVAERVGPRGLTRVVQARSGPVLAAAGVDASNVAPGTVLLLPADPDASARSLRAHLTARTGLRLGVLISDTAGRAWRDGQVDLAIGAAGVQVTDDLRGGTDPYGNPLEVTVRALADELACAADLVKGKLRKVPVAVLRGLADLVTIGDGPGAAALLRGPEGDWFTLGHVEAVRTALGVPPGTAGVQPVPLWPDGVAARLHRASTVALAGRSPFGAGEPGAREGTIDIEPDVGVDTAPLSRPIGRVGRVGTVGTVGRNDADSAVARVRGIPVDGPSGFLALGALVQRLVTAAWSEGLTTRTEPAPDGAVTVTAQLTPPPP